MQNVFSLQYVRFATILGITALSIGYLYTATPTTAHAASCIAASPNQAISDVAFDSNELLANWQDDPVTNSLGLPVTPGTVYIAPVDDATGLIQTAAETAMSVNPVASNLIKNGPEWGCSNNQCSTYYTTYSTDQTTTQIGKIFRDANGLWQSSLLPNGLAKIIPRGSPDFAATAPTMISYHNVTGNFQNRTLTETELGYRADVSTPTDQLFEKNSDNGRWLDAVTVSYVNKVKKNLTKTFYIKLLNTQTGAITTVAGGTTQQLTEPFPWTAPEYNNDQMLLFLHDYGTYDGVDIYHHVTTGWQFVGTVKSPDAGYQVIDSADPFTYNGHSYITFDAKTAASSKANGEIYVADLATLTPHMISDTSVSLRSNPKPLLIASGTRPVVYFSDKGANGSAATSTLTMCDAGI